MIPSKAVRKASAHLLAADTATLAPAVNANVVALVMSQFVPAQDLDPTTLTLATFNGSTPIAITTGTQPSGDDPISDDVIIDFSPPAGGFRWDVTGGANLPQTIYGYVVLDHTLATLIASALFPAPIPLTAIGQRVDDLDATLDFAANGIQ